MSAGAAFLEIGERSKVGAARRKAAELAGRHGFDDAAAGRLAVVVTEMAANMLVHAGGGAFFARAAGVGSRAAVEVLTVDRGPGIPDIEKALEDGFTTGSTAGTGLGAVRRMADGFHLHSVPGEGTVGVALVRAEPVEAAGEPGPSLGALIRPHPHEKVSGDGWGVRRMDGVLAVAVVDGLGHGPDACDAAVEAIRSFSSTPWEGTRGAIERIHGALRHTRGAVGGVLEVDPESGCVRFTGVGNVAASLVDADRKRSLLSMNGTLGLQTRTIREYEYPCRPGCVAVMHTDGVSGRWGPDEVGDLVGRPPSLLCGALYGRHYRGSDDATVVALRTDRADPGEGG